MSEQNRLATVKNAIDLLGVMSSSNPNKAITVAELQEMAPKCIATCDADNADMNYALVEGGVNLVLVNNLSRKAITINAGYGFLELKDGMYGGWFTAEDSSGEIFTIVFTESKFKGSAVVYWMKKDGSNFIYKSEGSTNKLINIGQEAILNVNNYVRSQVGNIYYIVLTED